MTVLHLISSGGMYGAEAVILNLSRALQQSGDKSIVASFSNASHQLHDRAVSEHLPVLLLPCDGPFSPQTLPRIREAVAAHAADVVHSHGYKADLYAWAALRGTGVALVSTCHTWYDNDLAVRVYGALDRWVLRHYACVVAVSAQVEQRLRRSHVSHDRIRQIRNGIDLLPFHFSAGSRSSRAEAAPLVAGLVGRLAPEKGVDLFLKAAALVAQAMPNVHFVVVGEGPERSRLEQQSRDLGLTGRLRLPGHTGDMPAVYASMDLLVSASRQEGLPIALLEGMAGGLPVVGTAVGEVPTLVLQGETGLLVAPEDADALAQAMLQLLRDRALRLDMGRKAHALVEQQFSVERMTHEYRDVYLEALSSAGAVA